MAGYDVSRRQAWLENTHEQVKFCKVCHKSILLADWVKHNQRARPYEWNREAVCLPPLGEAPNKENNPCHVIANNWAKPRLRFDEVFSRAEVVKKFHLIREAYGFDEADTESTFSAWDLVKIGCKYQQKGTWNLTKQVDIETLTQFSDYFFYSADGLEIDGYVDWIENEPKTTFRFERRTPRYMARYDRSTVAMVNQDRKTVWYFYAIFKTIFPDEWEKVPIWVINRQTREALYEWQIIDEWRWEIDGKKNLHFFNGLFDKMLEEWYPNGVSFDDYSKHLITRLTELRGMHIDGRCSATGKYWWFPTSDLFVCGKHPDSYAKPNGRPVFISSIWAFIEMFQRYVKRKDDGTFGKFDCKKLDFKVYSFPERRKSAVEDLITHKDCIAWFWQYLIPFFGIEIKDKKNFPYNTPTNELLQFINLDCDSLTQVPGAYSFTRVITRQKGLKQGYIIHPSAETIIRLLYPDYKFDMVLWTTQSLKGESKMNQILLKVMTWAGFDWNFSNAEYIPTLKGGFAKYWDTKAHMKIDGISLLLKVVAEAQGLWHYSDDKEDIWLNDGVNYSQKVPDGYRGKDRSPLGYRQNRDRLCRKAIIRNGFTPVYVILTSDAYPVKGVHGDIPRWNMSYVTAENSSSRIGLAETFDMQGRKDIGDMIRDYYYNVVLNEEE